MTQTETQVLRLPDLGFAPEAPGLYAWYVEPPLSEDDWRDQFRGESDRTATAFLGALTRFSNYFAPQQISLTGGSNYQIHWRAEVKQDGLDAALDPEEPDDHIRSITESELGRKVAVHVLSRMTPEFSSPLYIGVATNLRNRLDAHLREFTMATDAARQADSIVLHRLQKGKSLGLRLAGAKIPYERLMVYVLPIEIDNESIADIRHAAEGVEWLLQRVFQPTLGRS